MEMEPISYSLKDVLVRQGIARGLAGTRSRGNKTASSPVAGEEGPHWDRSPTTRREVRVELNSGKKDGAAKPRRVTQGVNAQEPSSARSRPVPLTLINGGSRYKGVSKAPLYLVQP